MHGETVKIVKIYSNKNILPNAVCLKFQLINRYTYEMPH